MNYSRRDINRLAGEVGADTRTVEKWLRDPDSVKAVVAYALEVAADKLGIPKPSPADESPEAATG